MSPIFKNYMVLTLAAVVVAGAAAVDAQQPAQAHTSVVVAVDCGGASLQDAIDAAASHTRIDVTGVCAEDVRIPGDKADLTILGVTPDAGIDSEVDMTIHGHQITVDDMNFTGGAGIIVDNGSATIKNNLLDGGGAGAIGIQVDNSAVATILSNKILSYGRGGILVTSNSMIYVGVTGGGGGAAQPNLLDGEGTGRTASAVKIRRTSRGRVEGNCIRNWGQTGVRIDTHASAQVSGNVIAGNDRGGISVAEVSVLTLAQDSADTIHNANNSHLLNGVTLPGGALFEPCDGFPVSSSDNQPNTGIGIECENTSLVSARHGNELTVAGTVSNLVINHTCHKDLSGPGGGCSGGGGGGGGGGGQCGG